MEGESRPRESLAQVECSAKGKGAALELAQELCKVMGAGDESGGTSGFPLCHKVEGKDPGRKWQVTQVGPSSRPHPSWALRITERAGCAESKKEKKAPRQQVLGEEGNH